MTTTYLTTGTKSLSTRLSKLGYSSYSEYLSSNHWKELKLDFKKRSKKAKKMVKKYGRVVCDICHEPKKYSMHHKTYKRLGGEFLDDIIPVCDNCHRHIHILHSNGMDLWRATKNGAKDIRRFQRLNRQTKEKVA